MIKLQEFAKQQGVTDRQVQRLIKKYEVEISGHFERKGQQGTWLDDEACKILKGKMKQTTSQTRDGLETDIVAILKEELDAKNKQIEELTKLLDQEQQLHAAAQQKLMLLEAPAEKSEQKKWFEFWR